MFIQRWGVRASGGSCGLVSVMQCILNVYVYYIKFFGVFGLQYCNVPNLQLLITLKILFQHLHNFHQLVALSSPSACHPQHIQLTCLQNVCDLSISDFQNWSCCYGPGSSRETVKLLGKAELPDTLHASYMFIQTHFCCQSTFEYNCTNREAQSC
jgi:hypothetical protein